MFDYPLASTGTDMWLVSHKARKQSSKGNNIHLPATLSEFNPDFWLAKDPQDAPQKANSDPLLNKWLLSGNPLNKPLQTTTIPLVLPRSNSTSLKGSVSEWVLSGSPTNSSCSLASNSECSSIEILENDFMDFHLVSNQMRERGQSPTLSSYAPSNRSISSHVKHNNNSKWLCS